MKGIILAGGSGTRLYPITKGISKQLVPIYDKPMIYYPLSTLMSAGIREILIITTPHDQQQFINLLGDGSDWGISLTYITQPEPKGLAEAFTIGEDFLAGDKVTMVLGDNIFYGSEFESDFTKAVDSVENNGGGIIFGQQVADPERYGIVEFDDNGNVLSIEEKPAEPKSNYAIPGLYIFDNNCVQYAKNAQPSARDEIEITEIHNAYLNADNLRVTLLDRGTAWLDTGTFESMNQASQFVEVVEKRQGIKIGCPEEIAYQQGFITKEQLLKIAEPLQKSGYGDYLASI